MKWIALHKGGNVMYLNIDRATLISPKNSGSLIEFEEGDGYYVDEAPEQILEMARTELTPFGKTRGCSVCYGSGGKKESPCQHCKGSGRVPA